MVRHLLLPLLLLASAPALAQRPLKAVPELDLERYSGTWHEIARLPMYFQRKCARDVTATYTLLDDGNVTVSNACVRDDGVHMQSDGMARMAGSNPAKLEVRFAPAWLGFLPGVWADYWVLAVDADYQWAIVGEPDREYLWILSRQPTMDEKSFEALKARARTMEYDLSELIISSPPG